MAGGHRHRLHARRPRARGRRGRGAAGRRRGRGSRPPARPPPTTRWRRPGATCCRCSASASRPTSTPRRRPTPPSRASPRCAPTCPTRIVDRLALGPRELEERFGIMGGHIFHGEMLPGQLLEDRPDRRRFGGVEGLYLAGSGAHPGGAVTGARGYWRRGGARGPGRTLAGAASWSRQLRGLETARSELGSTPDHGSVFVTRRLPGTALDRLAAEHEVEVWPERLPPPREELRRRAAGARGCSRCSPTAVDAELIARRAGPAGDLQLRRGRGQRGPGGGNRARDTGGQHARRAHRGHRGPGAGADARRSCAGCEGRGRRARRRLAHLGARTGCSGATCTRHRGDRRAGRIGARWRGGWRASARAVLSPVGRRRAARARCSEQADFVTLHCPLTAETRGLIGDGGAAAR